MRKCKNALSQFLQKSQSNVFYAKNRNFEKYITVIFTGPEKNWNRAVDRPYRTDVTAHMLPHTMV